MVDRIVSAQSALARYRLQRGWSQALLAQRSQVSRAEVSAVETGRIVPSVLVALRLASALNMPVEALFGSDDPHPPASPTWAWAPPGGETRAWRATLDGAVRLYPVELTAAGAILHDSLVHPQGIAVVGDVQPERTLVMAGCDPLVGVIVQTMAQNHGIRVIPLLRSSEEALELLRQGLVHVAGIHLTSDAEPADNDHAVRTRLGGGYRLLHQMEWDTGIATAPLRRERTVRSILNARLRWVNREEGSAARRTLDGLLGQRQRPRGYDRVVRGHSAVAATVSSGWAEAGVCIRPAAVERDLGFISLQRESYELCVADGLMDDPRVIALAATLRCPRYRQFVANTPGCGAARSGEHRTVQTDLRS